MNFCRWKDSVEQRLQRMENIMKQVPNSSTSDLLSQMESPIQLPGTRGEDIGLQNRDTSQSQVQVQQPWEVVMDPGSGPGAIPASCVTEAPGSSIGEQRPGISRDSDIISRGIISLATAENYLALYRQRLDPIVYYSLADHHSLASIRAKSTLLIAVICAVSALHSASPDYQACYQAFRDEFTTQILSKEHSFDDVRALCIAAFFLSDMSWILVGAGQSAFMSFIL
jgi:hypothetical protein